MGNSTQPLTYDQARMAFADAGVPWDGTVAALLAAGAPGTSDGDEPGLLVSDQCPATLSLTVFAGDRRTDVVEERECSGSLLGQLTDALDFVDGHAGPGPRWPEQAVREAVTNAILHRDYATDAPTMVELYDDHLRIVSPGGFPGDLTLGDVLNGAVRPRNPRLLAVFRRLGLARGRGTGIPRIVDAYGRADVPPQLTVAPRSVSLTLPLPAPEDDATRSGRGPWASAGTLGFDPKKHPKIIPFPSPLQPRDALPRPWTIIDYGGGEMTALLGEVPPVGHAMARTDAAGDVVTAELAEDGQAVDVFGAGLDDSPAQTRGCPGAASARLDGQTDAEGVVSTPLAGEAELSNLEEAMLELFRVAHADLTRQEIQQEMHASEAATRTALHRLSEQGLIVRVGNSRATRYRAL